MSIRSFLFNSGDTLMELGVCAAIVPPGIIVGFCPPATDRETMAFVTGASAIGFMSTLPISAPLYCTGLILKKISGVDDRKM